MDYDKLPNFGQIDDDEDGPQRLIDRGAHPTKSIDFRGLMLELDALGRVWPGKGLRK